MTAAVGILGLGLMGRRMVQRFADHPEFRVVAGWDPDSAAVNLACELEPGLRAVSGPEELCALPELDLVYIAAPPAAHLPLASLAFDRGLAVLCEKPLAVDLDQAEAMVERVTSGGHRAAVNYVLAGLPALAIMQRSLTEDELGPARGAAISVGFQRWPRPWQADAAGWLSKRAEGGFTREVISHFLFVVRRLLGPLEVVESRVTWPADPAGSELEVMATLTAGGQPVHLSGHVGRISVDDRNELVITAERGALRLHDWRQLERSEGGNWKPVREAREPDGPGSGQLNAIAAWLAGQPHPLASFTEALDVQRCVEELLNFQE